MPERKFRFPWSGNKDSSSENKRRPVPLEQLNEQRFQQGLEVMKAIGAHDILYRMAVEMKNRNHDDERMRSTALRAGLDERFLHPDPTVSLEIGFPPGILNKAESVIPYSMILRFSAEPVVKANGENFRGLVKSKGIRVELPVSVAKPNLSGAKQIVKVYAMTGTDQLDEERERRLQENLQMASSNEAAMAMIRQAISGGWREISIIAPLQHKIAAAFNQTTPYFDDRARGVGFFEYKGPTDRNLVLQSIPVETKTAN